MYELSLLQHYRQSYQPILPKILQDINSVELMSDSIAESPTVGITEFFPHTGKRMLMYLRQGDDSLSSTPLKVGIVLSGGPAAGGHNVIAGLWDALQAIHQDSQLIGFQDGFSGVIHNRAIVLSAELISHYRNQGGFDLLGSGRTKIDTEEQIKAVVHTLMMHALDGLVIVGGDDSNTNAAYIAEFCEQHQITTRIVGVPKTIDGDLKNNFLDISFGFDTACKVYSEIIGNLARDALSQKKYYFFVKMMGRTASHITLECALNTCINLALISEEIGQRQLRLLDIIHMICDLICKRADLKKNYGIILIPEGLLEFIPECQGMIQEINHILSTILIVDLPSYHDTQQLLKNALSTSAASCFFNLPEDIQKQLLLDRDPHGNIQVSKIETDRLIVNLVERELSNRSQQGTYTGQFNAQTYFCGYEGRSALPSNFDCNYCTTLGYIAAVLIREKANGYMCSIKNLAKEANRWQLLGVPLTSLLHMEMRNNKMRLVIEKALVDLKGDVFQRFAQNRDKWQLHDDYCYPGPIQFAGPSELINKPPLSILYT